MSSLTRNKDICTYHFLNNMDAAEEQETPVVPATVAATAQDCTVVMACKEEKTCEQNEIKFHVRQERMEELNKSIEDSEQRHEFIEILIRKDGIITNLSLELKNLEIRLHSAVTGKLDALARLENIEGKEQTLLFKEKQMSLDMENRDSTIESLKAELDKNVTELTSSRREHISASAQFEIDIKEMSEKLRIAHLNIGELSQTNEQLKLEKEGYVHKLREQFNESRKMMKAYEDELKAKTALAQLHKDNSADYEAEMDDLNDGVIELKRLLSETVDFCGVLETRLKETELDNQTKLDGKDEMITKLQQELKDANCLLEALKARRSTDSDNNDTGDVAEETKDFPCPLTYTELYSQWRGAAKQLQNKEQECKTLQTEMTHLLEEITEKAVNFEKQQNELEQHKAANDQLNEERNCFIVEKVVGREELESTRLRCELLKNENDKLKRFDNENLRKFFANHQPSNDNLNAAASSDTGTKSDTIELEQQNEKLLAIINNLMANSTNEIPPNESMKENTAIGLVISSTNVCHKSVEVTEGDLMIAGNQCRSDIENRKSEAENLLLLLDELKQDNHKLQNTTKRELTAERNLLLADQKLFNVRYNLCKDQIKSLHRQNQKYVNTVQENTLANKYLRDEIANVSMKLSTTQERLFCLENQHRSLGHVKSSLVIEVETLKQELAREKVSNKTQRYEVQMMKKSLKRKEIELQMKTLDNSDCRVMVQRLERSVEDLSQNISKLSTDEAVQTDFENGDHGCDADISSEIMDDLSPGRMDIDVNSLQLVKSEPSEVTSRKRKTQNVAEAPTRLRTKRQSRVSFVDLSGESDEEVNVCDVDSGPDLPNIELQYLSEVRTRKQAKFILDAFSSKNSECSRDGKADEKGAFKPKSTRRSNRSRSSGSGRSSANVPIPIRSRSADYRQLTVGQQQANCMPAVAPVGKVSNPKPKRRRGSKGSRSCSNGPSHGSNRVSSTCRSSTATSQQLNSDRRQHLTDYECYILLPEASNSSQPTNWSAITVNNNNRRSHRLISRYRRQTVGSLK